MHSFHVNRWWIDVSVFVSSAMPPRPLLLLPICIGTNVALSSSLFVFLLPKSTDTSISSVDLVHIICTNVYKISKYNYS